MNEFGVTAHDWSADGYRHFYYRAVCDDTSEMILARVEDCLTRLGDISEYIVYVRAPLSIERGGTNNTMAKVFMRVAIDLESRLELPKYLGLRLPEKAMEPT